MDLADRAVLRRLDVHGQTPRRPAGDRRADVDRQEQGQGLCRERHQGDFADVAGVDEAKEELQEVVDFLKDPENTAASAARIPKGILLVGPPGTGKTLLARAVAGEAGVPFFSISGSEFVEMFVGVGAARVRDLFEQARKGALHHLHRRARRARPRPRRRSRRRRARRKGADAQPASAELDGFDPRIGMILLAATNRPGVLDPALLRAGRFDRQVLVDRPDKTAAWRSSIHKKISWPPTSISKIVASLTPGFTGADLANLVNEAALLATRRGADAVTLDDFTAAIERIVAGLEKKNRLLNPHEREIVAHHEMGHALVAMALPGTDTVHKVSIIPRGIGALGYTMQRPTEDRFLMTRGSSRTRWRSCSAAGRRSARLRRNLDRRRRRSRKATESRATWSRATA